MQGARHMSKPVVKKAASVCIAVSSVFHSGLAGAFSYSSGFNGASYAGWGSSDVSGGCTTNSHITDTFSNNIIGVGCSWVIGDSTTKGFSGNDSISLGTSTTVPWGSTQSIDGWHGIGINEVGWNAERRTGPYTCTPYFGFCC